jgi:hypothetical protein
LSILVLPRAWAAASQSDPSHCGSHEPALFIVTKAGFRRSKTRQKRSEKSKIETAGSVENSLRIGPLVRSTRSDWVWFQ